MKRPTVIETLAFLGLALTGIRTDQSGTASFAETPGHQGPQYTRVQPETLSNFESADTLLSSKKPFHETHPTPHQ